MSKDTTVFPAIHSILDADRLEELIYDKFGIRAICKVTLIQSGFNDHYAFTSEEGDFVIRVYRAHWRSNEEVLWELTFIDHLAKNGIAVARALRQKDDHWFSEIQAIEGTRQVALFQRAPGPYTHFGKNLHYRISAADYPQEFGESMAQLHAVADSFQSTASRFSLNLEHLLDDPLAEIQRVFSHRPEELNRLQEQVEHLKQRIAGETTAFLDWGPCHGDISGGNSTCWNKQLIHFDFDFSGPGWRAYDLGVFFWSMSINGYGDELWQRFQRGYLSQRSLPERDLALVRAFAAIRVIWLMGTWCANAQTLGHHHLHDDYFDRELKRLTTFVNPAS